MKLLPMPNGDITRSNGEFSIPHRLIINVDAAYAPLFEVFERRILKKCKLSTVFSTDNANIVFEKIITSETRLNWHRICVEPSVIKVNYADENSLVSALVTLFLLMQDAVFLNKPIACVSFEDYAKYPHRGMHLDTARHYFEPAEIKKIIEQLSLLKMNVLHWHFADDQAWRIEIKAYPNLTSDCGDKFYTQNEVLDIVDFALKRGVKIIPEIEIPGHNSAAIAVYPHLSCKGEQIEPATCGGIYKIILCAGKAEVYAFIEKVLDEITSMFPSDIIHLGGDEAPKDEWQKCPLCLEKLKEVGVISYENLQGYMINYAKKHLEDKGRKVICWNECLKAQNLDKDIYVQYWVEMGGQSYCAPRVKKDIKVILSNLSAFYFDYPHSVIPLKKTYEYTPKIKNIDFSASENVIGLEGALWTERIETNEQLEYMMFPRVIAVSERAWSYKQDYTSFKIRLNHYYNFLKKANINVAPLALADVRGTKRIAQNASFALVMMHTIKETMMCNNKNYKQKRDK